MKKTALLIVCTIASAFISINASVTIRFWDNGVLVHTATETENAGGHPYSYYYSETPASCDGYTFIGWKLSAPIVNETIYANDEAVGLASTINVGTSDIDLYAVYKKTVTCYTKIDATTGLEGGGKYLVVGYNSSNTSYHAMGNMELGSGSYQGVSAMEVTPCETNNTIYSVDAACIWTLSVNNSNYILQNDNTSKYLYVNDPGQSYFMLQTQASSQLLCEVNSGAWTLYSEETNLFFWKTYYYLNFAIENDYSGLSSFSNIFTASQYNTRTSRYDVARPKKEGSIYLYKQGTELRYKSKCSAYTLQFSACGDNSCGSAVSLDTTTITETQTTPDCVGLSQFSGVNPNSVTPTVDCPSIWTFEGWATAPCPNKSLSAPTYIIANPYALYHQNDMLYAVYRHNVNGVDYWSSYPLCNPFKVTFDPCYGKIGSSSNPQVETESTIGAGVTTLAASFSTCTGWDFAGWAKTPCTGAASTPSGLIADGITYYPEADGETLYAVYKKNSLWTSYPMCAPASITLDAGTGTVDGNTTMIVNEPSINSGITLSTDAEYPKCDNVSIWTFVGWSTTKISGNTTVDPQPYTHNALYRPTTPNADVLYAVYRRGTAGNYIYTSMPSCAAFHVILNNNGTEQTLTESSIGAGITFLGAAVDCSDRWTFAGWKQASPVEHSYTLPDGLYAAAATYTPAQDNETFFAVFKHNATNYWTSNPDCTLYTIYLHACEGAFDGGLTTKEASETTAGAGIVLPSVNPLCKDRGWKLEGWVEGGDLTTTNNISGLTIHKAGTTYVPSQNGIDLYAVYTMSQYKQVTKTTELNAGDKYVVAFYYNYGTSYSYTDFALSNVPHAAPYADQLSLYAISSYTDENGNKFVVDPSANCVWVLGGSTNQWTFRENVQNGQYLHSEKKASGTSLGSSTTYTYDLTNHKLGRYDYQNQYRYLYFMNESMNSFRVYQYNSGDLCYLYRYMGTYYSSWPHCEEYTVYFDGCDGTANTLSLKEEDAGLGITLPGVTNTCGNGWEFAGWATEIVDEKTSDLKIDLYPEGAVFIPNKNNMTLYAVYQQLKEGQCPMISSQEELLLGRNYFIKYPDDIVAMSNSYSNRNGIVSEQIIAANYDRITWRLQGTHGAYVLYNPNADKYLDLTGSYANLQTSKNDNFSITYQGNNQFSIKSNKAASSPYLRGGSSYFTKSSSAYAINLCRQEADYWSYPCSTPVEPIAWGNGTVTVESFDINTAPTAGSVVVGNIEAQEDGTYLIHHTGKPGRRLRIAWGGNYYTMTIPYVASPMNTPPVENQPKQNLVVLPNAKFTVKVKTWLHTASVYEDAELIIAEGDTLFVDTLYLRSVDADHHPSVTFAGATAAIVIKSGVIYHDRRIDYHAYYPFGMPYDANISDIKFAGLIATSAQPVYRSNYWLKYYDGVTRAKDANAGTVKDTYWEHVTSNTLKGGIGYSIAIADDYAHTKRTFRFTMRPMNNWQKYEGGEDDRVVTIAPSKVNSNTRKHHSGWNFICNPYLHTYYPGATNDNSGMLNGRFEQKNGKWVIADDSTKTVPYLTFYDISSRDYYQKRADNSGLKPFSPVFIQVENHDQLLYKNPLQAEDKNSAPGLRRSTNPDEPRIVKTGLLLTAANGRTYDEMGLVISNRYTNEYEIGADLAKERAKTVKLLHVYTMNATHALAYNALDEQSAAQPIPVGVRIPQAGSYTFRFDEFQYNADDLEALYLTDYEKNVTVDLLDEDYTCTISQGVNEERFAINAILHKETNTPTDVESVSSNGIQVLTNQDGSITICSNNRLTQIIVYDVAGRLVEEAAPNAYQWTLNLPQGIYAISLKGENSQGTHIKVCSK